MDQPGISWKWTDVPREDISMSVIVIQSDANRRMTRCRRGNVLEGQVWGGKAPMVWWPCEGLVRYAAWVGDAFAYGLTGLPSRRSDRYPPGPRARVGSPTIPRQFTGPDGPHRIDSFKSRG